MHRSHFQKAVVGQKLTGSRNKFNIVKVEKLNGVTVALEATGVTNASEKLFLREDHAHQYELTNT